MQTLALVLYGQISGCFQADRTGYGLEWLRTMSIRVLPASRSPPPSSAPTPQPGLWHADPRRPDRRQVARRTRTLIIGGVACGVSHLLMAFRRASCLHCSRWWSASACSRGNITSQVGGLYRQPICAGRWRSRFLHRDQHVSVIVAPLVSGTLGEGQLALGLWHRRRDDGCRAADLPVRAALASGRRCPFETEIAAGPHAKLTREDGAE